MRRIISLLSLALLCCALALLTGCAGLTQGESLYRLPKLPAEYESLETLIDTLIAGGAEYAAPTSGSNLQSVQMVDLDGDGTDEAVAFLRRASDEKPMKIYIFRAVADSYEQYCLIEGTSNAIYSVTYTDLDGDGRRELLAGIRGNADVQNLAVYTLDEGEARPLLVTGYSRYVARDIDGDGRQDLIVIRSDEESAAVADYYAWNGAEMELYATQRLSSAVSEVSRLTAGRLSGGETALFITAVTEDSNAVTDILTVRDGSLQTVTRSGETFHFLGLYPTDVDGDGATEVPQPAAFPRVDPEGPTYYRIYWCAYAADGSSRVVREAFQDTAAGWSLTLPSGWGAEITVSRASNADGSAVSFARLLGDGAEAPFLTVYTFTADNREQLARRSGRIQLLRLPDTVYAAELGENAAGLIDETALRERFSRIVSEWTTGEN